MDPHLHCSCPFVYKLCILKPSQILCLPWLHALNFIQSLLWQIELDAVGRCMGPTLKVTLPGGRSHTRRVKADTSGQMLLVSAILSHSTARPEMIASCNRWVTLLQTAHHSEVVYSASDACEPLARSSTACIARL